MLKVIVTTDPLTIKSAFRYGMVMACAVRTYAYCGQHIDVIVYEMHFDINNAWFFCSMTMIYETFLLRGSEYYYIVFRIYS